MHEFLIFVAPFILLIISIIFAFLVASRDESVRKDE
ncbi:cytochrome bd oxidase small subunit CydS [Bacillus taeanensis]